MNDLISRQVAIDVLHEYFTDGFDSDKWWNSTHVIQALTNVPSAQKTGRWITDAAEYYGMLNERGLTVDEYTPYFTDDIACSQCLAKYNIYDNETQFFKHCPNCGARMDGDADADKSIPD